MVLMATDATAAGSQTPREDPQSSATAFEFPVVFVAERLESRWQELMQPGAVPRIEELPSTRFLVLEDIWVVSTYLRLRQAGYPVEIASQPRNGAINIACSPRVQLRHPLRRGVMVAIRADRARQTWGDLSLVQSPLNIEGKRDWLIDHWPQPNIIPRDPARGDRVERVGILSPMFSIAPELAASQFRGELEALGFELDVRTDGVGWNDYASLDVQIAFRASPMMMLRTKPATKIVQSWIARCPAIAGVEPCFRAYGRPGSDYLEATSARGIIDCLVALREERGLYRSLIDNGARKAPLHDEAAVRRQWVDFLKGPAAMVMREHATMGTGSINQIAVQAAVLSSVVRHRWLMCWTKIYARLRRSSPGRRMPLRA